MATITSLDFNIFSTYDGRGTSQARRDIDQLDSDIDTSNAKIASLGAGITSVAVNVAQFGPALLPIAAAALGVAGAFGTMAVAGGAAAGVFGAAVVAAFHGTSAASKEMQGDLANVKTSFSSWGNSIASTVAGPVGTALNALSGSFSQLTPIVQALAPEAQRVASAFSGWVNSGLTGWVQWVQAVGVPILHNLDSAVMSMAGVFGSALRAFSPLAVSMSSFIAQLASKASTWATGGGFDRFVAMIQANGPSIKAFFSALWAAIQNVGKVMVSLGPASLSLATALLKIIANCPPATLSAIVQLFIAWKSPITALFAIFPGLAGAVSRFINAMPVGVIQGITTAIIALKLGLTGLAIVNTIASAFKAFQDAVILTRIQMALLNVQMLLAKVGIVATAVAEGIAAAAQWLWNAAVLAFELITSPIILVLGLIVIAIAAVGFAIYELVTNWTTVWNAIKVAAETVWGWLQTAWNALWGAIQTVAAAVWGWLQSTWNTIWGGIQAVAQAIWGWLQSTWNTIWGGIQSVAQAIWGWLQSTWNTIWSGIQAVAQSVWGWLQSTWNTIWSGIQSVAQSIWSWLQSTWNSIWNGIQTVASNVWGWIKSTWNSLWNDIKGVVEPIWNWLSSTWSSIWNGIKKVAGDVWGWLKSTAENTWNDIKGAVDRVWKDIANAFVAPVNFVIQTVWDGGIVRVWNDTVSKLPGMPDLPKVDPIPKFAKGGQVQMSPGAQRGKDSVLAMLMPDEHVLTVDQVKQLGGHNSIMQNLRRLPHLAGGGSPGGGASGSGSNITVSNGSPANPVTEGEPGRGGTQSTDSAPTGSAQARAQTQQQQNNAQGSNDNGDPITQGINFLVDLITKGAAATLKAVADPLLKLIPGGQPFRDYLTKFVDGEIDQAGTEIDKLTKKVFADGGIGGAGTIPTSEHKALIDLALAADGIPAGQWPAWESGMNTLITRESAWNASAVNGYDINAQNGTPSEGLAQVIAPTFAAYRNPALPNNLLDPVANIAASINYINAVYGGIGNVQQANASAVPRGYWTGTSSAMRGWGMIDEQGGEWINFGGGEKVLPHGRMPKMMKAQGASPVNVEVHHHWPDGVTKETVEAASTEDFANKIRMAVEAGVGKR